MTRDDVRKKLEGIVLDNYDFCIAMNALSIVSRIDDKKDVYCYDDILKLEVTLSFAKFPMLFIMFMEEGEMYKRGYYIKHIRMKVTPSPIRLWLGKFETELSDENNRALRTRTVEHVRNSSLLEEEEAPPREQHTMTDREICERIVAQGNCGSISCGGIFHSFSNYGTECPLYGEGRYHCADSSHMDKARLWLEEHPAVQERCVVEEEESWKPKYGDHVFVSDRLDFKHKIERIYIVQDGDKHVCFSNGSEVDMDTRAVCTMRWKYVRQIPAKDKL